ncbi:MAG: energy-coupling factor ABC transporter ATP-binding protein [Anaerovoracaceae bacterium]|jgi:energy-coupling factor transport system ATP-binding protein
MNIITAEQVTFSYEGYDERRVLDDLSFAVQEGSITALAGLSGCGKSTLCQALTGIIPACVPGDLRGRITLAGEDITGKGPADLAETVGFVMQDPDRQIVATTVEDELAFGPENLCLDPVEIRHRVDEVMELLRISDLAVTSPAKLSGGQKQLVAIGSVLTMRPRVLIMDEPFSHIDEEGKTILKGTLERLRESGRTILLVDHDYKSLDFVDKILWMEKGKISEHRSR